MKWKGVTKAETSRATGISLSTLKLELSDPEPNTHVVAKVLRHIDLPMDALFSERDLSPLEVDILGAVRKMPEDKQRALLDLIRG